MNEEVSPQSQSSQIDLKPATIQYLSRKNMVVLSAILAAVIGGGYFLMKNDAVSPQTSKAETTQPKGNNSVKNNEAGNVQNNQWKYYRIRDNIAYYYYENQKIDDADVHTFQEIGDRWAKDKNNVYGQGEKHTYLDPASLAVIAHGYAKDKNSIYYFEEKIIGADVQSFILLRDMNSSLDESVDGWYAKDKNNVYYRSAVVSGVDVQNFVFLGGEYGKDKTKVYYEGKILANADVNSFTLVDGYAKDGKHIFFGDTILNIKIDPAQFVVVGGGAIKDNKQVYFQNVRNDKYELASGVDASTFEYVGICESAEKFSESYFKDKVHVFTRNFSGGNPISPADSIDVSSFQYLGEYAAAASMPFSISYAKDKNHVYNSCGEILADADVTSFVDLKDGYAKDKNKVWYIASLLSSADAATFRSLGYAYAKDKLNAYFAGSVIRNADSATFAIIVENVAANEFARLFAKDKNYVYSEYKINQGIDPANCTVQSIQNCSD